MSLFYVPNLASGNILPEEESQHAVKVLRLQVGSAIEIVDGTGGFYNARITNPHPKHCGFEIIKTKTEFGKRNYKLHIAIAPTKNIERLEWFIEKATEIGIDKITPIVCRFSERKIIKEERMEKIIVSAAKQSVKAYFPKLNPLCTFDEFMRNHQSSQKFIAHCYTSPPTPLQGERGEKTSPIESKTEESISVFSEKMLLQNEIVKSSDMLILIGPEGDFSKEEVQKAIALGFIPVSLGESRLRTETAGVVACCTAAIINSAL
ncbi:MAG: 16S rRNA (uracil(1498)-N(3))-methyltransferase [Paludibacter sp.]|nr:16S rRNA (uracil(1498)-N(3))-methyltransferase [Paludibacter sp.]